MKSTAPTPKAALKVRRGTADPGDEGFGNAAYYALELSGIRVAMEPPDATSWDQSGGSDRDGEYVLLRANEEDARSVLEPLGFIVELDAPSRPSRTDTFRELVELASLRGLFDALRAVALEFTHEAVGNAVPEYREILEAAVAAAPGSEVDRGTAIHDCIEIQRMTMDSATGYAALAARHLIANWRGFGEVGGQQYFPPAATLEALLSATRAAADSKTRRAGPEVDVEAIEDQEFQRILTRAWELLSAAETSPGAAPLQG